MSYVEDNHLRKWLNCFGTVCVQENKNSFTKFVTTQLHGICKKQANLINVNEGPFFSLLQTVNGPVEV
jgi:hypothetical protein